MGEGSFAATHVVGCSHGCRFPCYAFLMMQRFGKVTSYEEWCRPRLVSNALQLAQHELPRLRGKATAEVRLSIGKSVAGGRGARPRARRAAGTI